VGKIQAAHWFPLKMSDNGVQTGHGSATGAPQRQKGERSMLKFMKAYALAAMLTLGLVSFLAPRAAAQDGKISGSVLDFDGKPWVDLTIKIKSDQGATQEGKTDSKGIFLFPNLRSGKYNVSILASQLQAPFEVVVEVKGSDSAPVNLNFKDILEKQNPEAAAAYKKRQEEQAKTQGMKEHFANGVTFLDQERLAKAEVAKLPVDQRDAAKAKVADLGDKAVAEFKEAQKTAADKDPNTHVFWARIGEAYDLAGRNDDAINAYQQAIAAKPENASYYNNLGNILGRSGKIDEARTAYTKSAELDPPNAAMAWRNFGISLYTANRMQEAVEPLKKSVEIDPKSAQAYYLLGACLVASADYKQVGDKMEVTLKPGTVEAYQKAVELDPNGTWGKQAKEGLEQVNLLTGGIDMKAGKKKKS
jgi:tetratricopeptide (TPR) repeat protein